MEQTPDLTLNLGQDPWHLNKQVSRCHSQLLEMKDKVGDMDGFTRSDHELLETVAAHFQRYREWTEKQVDRTFVRIDNLDGRLSDLTTLSESHTRELSAATAHHAEISHELSSIDFRLGTIEFQLKGHNAQHRAITDQSGTLERQADDLGRRITSVDDRVARVDNRLNHVATRLDSHDERFDDIDKQLGEIKQLLAGLGADRN
jgi:chromosome segregation ATPase